MNGPGQVMKLDDQYEATCFSSRLYTRLSAGTIDQKVWLFFVCRARGFARICAGRTFVGKYISEHRK